MIGPFKNGGSDDRPKGSPEAVNVHDFADKTLGKVAPYGIYDPLDNRGWVSLGIDHDTAEFAVNAIRTWHERVGSVRYAGSDRLLITADCGGSNGVRVRLWKLELQKLAQGSALPFSRQVTGEGRDSACQDQIGRGDLLDHAAGLRLDTRQLTNAAAASRFDEFATMEWRISSPAH